MPPTVGVQLATERQTKQPVYHLFWREASSSVFCNFLSHPDSLISRAQPHPLATLWCVKRDQRTTTGPTTINGISQYPFLGILECLIVVCCTYALVVRKHIPCTVISRPVTQYPWCIVGFELIYRHGLDGPDSAFAATINNSDKISRLL